jgi:predicted transcriptional regulator
MSTLEIAKIFNVTSPTISNWLKSYNIPIRKSFEYNLKGREKLKPNELYNMYHVELLSMDSISKITGFGHRTINRCLIDYNIKTRNAKECQMVGRKKLNSDTLNDLYSIQKLSISNISTLSGFSKILISKWLNEYKIPIRNNKNRIRKKKIKITYDELYKLYLLDMLSMMKISKIFNTTPTTICRYIKEYNISPKPPIC